MLPVVQAAAWDKEPPHMSGYPHLTPPPPRHHGTRPLMPTVNPSTHTTKTRSGTHIRRYPPPPPLLRRMARCRPPLPPPPYGAPPLATSELPEVQPKALLGPFTDVAQINMLCGRLRNQPDRTSSVAALNLCFVRSRESHVCVPPVWCAKCFAPRWPSLCFHRIRRRPTRRGTISPLAERKELAGAMEQQAVVVLRVLHVCFFAPLEADVL